MSHRRLPPGQQLAGPNKWPLVGEEPIPWSEPWTVSVAGLVAQPKTWTVDALRRLPSIEREVDIHCVTRWSKLGARFRGVALAEVLAVCHPLPDARYVSFVAQSERGHSTSLLLTEGVELGALLAWEYEGKPLTVDHGGPLRVVTPGRYFYKSLKWLRRIDLLSEDQLGYWERSAGYHNHADPWKEERYLAPALDRREAAQLLETRDFLGRDLRSIEAANCDLAGLNARNAVLRDANFRRSCLTGASFERANLSNAHFQDADLRNAVFCNADLEGADFCGANLRGADLRGASLFGATFLSETNPNSAAQFDIQTRIDRSALEQLTPTQRAFVERRIMPPVG